MEENVAAAAPANAMSGSFVTPLLVSVLGIMCTSLSIVAYHFVFIRFCQQQRMRRQQANTGSQRLNPHIRLLPTGVDQQLLQTIPIIDYTKSKDDLTHVDQSECVVCLGELEEGDMVRLLPDCNHAFHVSCIDKWFEEHNSCPVCRSPMINPPVNSAAGGPIPIPILNQYEDDDDDDNNESSSRNDEVPSPQNDQDANNNTCSSSSPSEPAQTQSCRVLRHCVSLVLPAESRRSRMRLITAGLQRSLSLDQSHVVIQIQQRECQIDYSCSSSSSSASSKSDTTMSVWRFDRVSSRLFRSLSQFPGPKAGGILPY